MSELPTLGSMHTYGYGINDSGSVVGSLESVHAFVYANGTTHDLGTLGGAQSIAYGLNNAGQVVGKSDVLGNIHAFLYSGSTMHDLGTLGGTYSEALGINNLGQIVGISLNSANSFRGFLYSAGAMMPFSSKAQDRRRHKSHSLLRHR